MVAPEFVLKTVAPRVPRTAIARAALQRAGDAAQDRTAIAVVAPAGFGKTTLLALWRRRRIAQGALVGWLRADARDTPSRFTLGLLHAMHAASRRSAFDRLLLQGTQPPGTPQPPMHDADLDRLTELLAEIAALGHPVVLTIDDAHRLPATTVRRSLCHLLHHAPPNLHVVLGTRVPLPMAGWELVAKGELATLGIEDLRLTMEESNQVLRARFGNRLSPDDVARLHETTAGWPLGLHLVSCTIERMPDPAVAIASVSGREGDLEAFFTDALVARLSPSTTAFLERSAFLGELHRDLCEAVTGDAASGRRLARLRADTPIVDAVDADGWLRLHPLARDFLLARFEALPGEERRALHARAARWFAERERSHDAAVHALASGDDALTFAHAQRAVYSLTMQGRLSEARAWVDRMPCEALAGDVDLRLVASWALSVGDRSEDALAMLQSLRDAARLSPHQDFLRARAQFTAAAYADHAGALPALLRAWETRRTGPLHDPVEALAHANACALMHLHAGEAHRVPRALAHLPVGIDKAALRLPLAHRMTLAGIGHLHEGDPLRAIAAIAPALESVEKAEGRRSHAAGAFAAILAAALLEHDLPDEAEAALANRLDVIDRFALPDVLLLAHRTLARIALARGDERSALRVLDTLATLADTRRTPRLAMQALAERIRVHALQDRHATVDGLLREFDAMAPTFRHHAWRPFQPRYALQGAIAHAHAAIARADLEAATFHLDTAATHLDPVQAHRDGLTIAVLRAVAARRRREPDALQRLAEARSLGRLAGCTRLLAETHPLAVLMGAELDACGDLATASRPPTPRFERRHALRGGLLTSKEAEILTLLDRGMSNKSIARALQISHETVKWHLKNLSLKLGAGTRRHAVERARMLGLLGHAPLA